MGLELKEQSKKYWFKFSESCFATVYFINKGDAWNFDTCDFRVSQKPYTKQDWAFLGMVADEISRIYRELNNIKD